MAGKIKPLSGILIPLRNPHHRLASGGDGGDRGSDRLRRGGFEDGSMHPFFTDKGPIGKCCDGIKSLHNSAKSTADRQEVCGCLKKMAAAYSGINYDKAAGLPKECGVDIPYVISPDVDCSKVK